MKISLSNVHHNPHRNMARNPVNIKQVESLVDSMKRNTVWPNIVVRNQPGRPGHYELAYGHHRLTAMKQLKMTDCEFIVRDIDEWGMYCAMVDENESQQKITPELVYENITAGLETLEPLIRKCETVEEFNRAVPTGTAQTDAQTYSQVRNCLLDGRGIGRRFLTGILPGKSSTKTDNLQTVINSYYGKKREKAERAAQKAAELEAKIAKRKADQEIDERLKAELEADYKRLVEEAEEHRKKAFEIAGKTIDESILINFDSARKMSEFAGAVAREHIPQHHHANLANELINKGYGSQNYNREIQQWWYVVSGKAKADKAKAAKTQFKMKHSKDLDQFCRDLRANIPKWSEQFDAVAEYATELDDKAKEAMLGKARMAERSINRLITALTASNEKTLKDIVDKRLENLA